MALVPFGGCYGEAHSAGAGGAMAVMMASLFTVKVAGLLPKSTAVAPVKPVPAKVTRAPFGPEAGLTPVTVGAEGTTSWWWWWTGGRRGGAVVVVVAPVVVVVPPELAPYT